MPFYFLSWAELISINNLSPKENSQRIKFKSKVLNCRKYCHTNNVFVVLYNAQNSYRLLSGFMECWDSCSYSNVRSTRIILDFRDRPSCFDWYNFADSSYLATGTVKSRWLPVLVQQKVFFFKWKKKNQQYQLVPFSKSIQIRITGRHKLSFK